MIVGTEEVLYIFLKKFIKYIIYFKHILKYRWVGSDLIWRVCNFMTQTQPDPLKKKKNL